MRDLIIIYMARLTLMAVLILCLVASESNAIQNSLSLDTLPIVTFNDIVKAFPKALIKGYKGGRAGAFAGFVQVVSLMWLRTVVNYQYRYQVTMKEAFRDLYANGGILRFYKGLSFALVQGPLAKFGAIASNELALSMMGEASMLATLMGSVLSACWRIFLMPIDTCKTVLQVGGSRGFHNMMFRVQSGDVLVLYEGTWATVLSTVASHYPWFIVHNWLDRTLDSPTSYVHIVIRSAFIGFSASVASDTVSNILKVVKTIKQSASSDDLLDKESAGKHKILNRISYVDAIQQVLNEGGWLALFGRGLQARLLSNALQSVMFTVIWKLMTKSSKI